VSLLLSPLDALAERVGLSPDSEILAVALTHSSYAAEHECESNERLEFLGDAVVDLAATDLIFTAYPNLNEGSGSLTRSRVVNMESLAEAATRLAQAANQILNSVSAAGGDTTLLFASPALKRALYVSDVHAGPRINIGCSSRSDPPLMRRLKSAFDPQDIFAPGRFLSCLP